jgi:hypothetical protein
MSFDLIALDLDGTLLDADYKVSAANLRAVRQVHESGRKVVLVTGRAFASARSTALDLQLGDVDLVCHNGALTKKTISCDTVDCHLLSPAVARDALQLAQGLSLMATVSDEPQGLGRVVVEGQPHARFLRYIEMTATPWVCVTALGQHLADLAAQSKGLIQLTFSGNIENMERLERALSGGLVGRARFVKTAYRKRDFAVGDVINPLTSKKTGLAAVAERLRIGRQNILAVGDNYNDLDMLQYAGLGVIMGNADEKLRAMGFPVTAANDADGVAAAIQRYVLKNSGR